MEKRDNIDTSSLLALVEARPVLWDKWHQDYKDRPMTKSAWEHICKKLNPQYEELDKTDQTKFCRNLVRKWANIRARFSRARKSNKKYVFSNQLQFLVDVLDIHTDEDDSHSNKSEEVTKGSSFLEKVKTETTIIKTEPSIENMDDEETTDNTMSNNDDSSAEDCANATSSNPPEKFFPNIKVKIEPEDTDEDTDTDADADTDSGSASYDDMDIDQDDEVSLDCVKTEVKEEEDLIIEDDEHGCHMWLKEAASDPDLLYPNVTLEENPSRPAKRPRSDSYPNAESFLKNKENTLKNKENTLKNKENTLKKPLLKDVPPDPVVMEALGIVWASKLRSLEETQKVLAEDIVNQILKKGFFKELTRKSEVRKVS